MAAYRFGEAEKVNLLILVLRILRWAYSWLFSPAEAAVIAVAGNTDAMTGIYNRRAADQLIADSADSGGRCSVIFLDVDHFKQANDRHGHDVEDSVITQLAGIPRQRKRAGDFVARWGREEFVVILISDSAEESARVAKNLSHYIEHTKKLICHL